jgi:hypothetical protein
MARQACSISDGVLTSLRVTWCAHARVCASRTRESMAACVPSSARVQASELASLTVAQVSKADAQNIFNAADKDNDGSITVSNLPMPLFYSLRFNPPPNRSKWHMFCSAD